jgi:four helix bundle protein
MTSASLFPSPALSCSATREPLYRLRAFELARIAVDVGAGDVRILARDRGTRLVAGQLLRALGSITANIAEGYSRGTGPDRARFYEYALGSARESREWYRASARVLDEGAIRDRQRRLDAIVALTIGLVRDARRKSIRRDASS